MASLILFQILWYLVSFLLVYFLMLHEYVLKKPTTFTEEEKSVCSLLSSLSREM